MICTELTWNRSFTSVTLTILFLLAAASYPLATWAFEPDFRDLSMEQLLSRAREFQNAVPVKAVSSKSPETKKNLAVATVKRPRNPLTKKTFPSHSVPPVQIDNLVGRLASHGGSEQALRLPSGPTAGDHVSGLEDANLNVVSRIMQLGRSPSVTRSPGASSLAGVRAKALLCLDCGSNEVLLEQNSSEPLPIASITKLVTAMTVLDNMDLDEIVEVPRDIRKIEKHVVGIRPGDRITVRDLLYGLLIESGNDCAEALARAYPKGGRTGFLAAMKGKVKEIGVTRTKLFTPSGLDMKTISGRTGLQEASNKAPNTASAQDVALIARRAFSYPLIRHIASMKSYTIRTHNSRPREYKLVSNDKLLDRGLPLEAAKTGYTDAAGKCIVALFKDHGKERLVVVLNTQRHFNAAERIYRWASEKYSSP